MFGGENVKCPSCGSENNDSAKFCKNCGENLQVSSSQDKSSQDTSTQNTSAQIIPSSEPKSNKNLLIICATAVICVIIIAGAFLALNSSNSGISDNANSAMGLDDSGSSSSGYYQYNFQGYTFNIPTDYTVVNTDYDSETLFSKVDFANDNKEYIHISVRNNVPNLNKATVRNLTGESNGNLVLSDETFADIHGWGGDFEDSGISNHIFGFYSGDDVLIVGGSSCDLNKLLEDVNQEPIPDAPRSTTVESMSYSEAASYLSGASSTVIENTFDEADANGDGVLTGGEISKFKKLADLTKRTADTSNTENVEAQDYAGTGDGTTKTRYCTTHGRVAVGDDNLCPYCLDEGLDARTVKDSTEYI